MKRDPSRNFKFISSLSKVAKNATEIKPSSVMPIPIKVKRVNCQFVAVVRKEVEAALKRHAESSLDPHAVIGTQCHYGQTGPNTEENKTCANRMWKGIEFRMPPADSGGEIIGFALQFLEQSRHAYL